MSPSKRNYSNVASEEQQSSITIQLQTRDQPELASSSSSADVFEIISDEDEQEYRELKKRLLEIEYYRMQLLCREMEIKMNLPTSAFTESLYHATTYEE